MSESFVRYNELDLDYFARLLEVSARQTDARALAEKLLVRYGTIEDVLCVNPDELRDMVGEGVAATLKTLAAVVSRRVTDRFPFGRECTGCDVIDYFKAFFIGSDVEKVCLMCFDENNIPNRCDLVGVGTVNTSEVLPRRLLEAARRAGAKSVVIAHNHPSGSTAPSDEDIKFTASISRVLERVGIKLLYHCIIAGQRHSILEINDL